MSKTPLPYAVLRPAQIDYVRDADHTILIRPEDQKIYFLRGVEAAVWSWLILHYSYAKLVKMLAALSSVSNEQAEEELQNIFLKWKEAGILIQETTRNG